MGASHPEGKSCAAQSVAPLSHCGNFGGVFHALALRGSGAGGGEAGGSGDALHAGSGTGRSD